MYWAFNLECTLWSSGVMPSPCAIFSTYTAARSSILVPCSDSSSLRQDLADLRITFRTRIEFSHDTARPWLAESRRNAARMRNRQGNCLFDASASCSSRVERFHSSVPVESTSASVLVATFKGKICRWLCSSGPMVVSLGFESRREAMERAKPVSCLADRGYL